MNRIFAILVGLIAVSTLIVTASGPVQAAPPHGDIQMATFEGQTFDMADGWGSASAHPEIRACHINNGTATCYRSESQMNDATAGPTPYASCASSLRLYDGTSQTGAVINLTTRLTTLSLSTYGFDNRTSSYRVGGCSSNFYSGILSGLYGGNTSANASASTMLTGWDNAVSSVYIN